MATNSKKITIPKTTVMKKLLLTLASLATLSFASNAQLNFAPVAGLNLANLTTDSDGDDSQTKLGVHLGAVVNYSFNDRFSVEPGVLFSMKGAKGDGDYSVNLNYIEVPVNAIYTFPMGLMIHAGPYLGLLMSAKQKAGGAEADIKDFTQTIDFGLNAGVGYKLPMGLFARAQFGYGASNINKDLPGKASNTVVGITLGYYLRKN